MTVILRDYQVDLKAGIYGSWNAGNRNTLGVLATGGGKSVVVSDVALDFHNQRSKQAIIAHRNELVTQMSMHIARREIPHRIIGSDKTVAQAIRMHRKEFGRSFVYPDADAAVVGVDTLVKRKDQLDGWAAQIDLWTIDEAHHVIRENKWGAAVKMFPRALGLGVTATPCRADGMGLGRHADGVFDFMVLGPSMRRLMGEGALSYYQIAIPESDFVMDEKDVAKGGDFSPQKLKKAAQKSRIVGDVVKEYCKLALGKRAICFATDVETAGQIASKFVAAGIPAVSVSAETDPAVREKYINDFREGRIWILVNVDLFDEGFDVPACEVVIMARPTASLNKYLQMFGRCLRPAPGKQFGLVIDHVSNWKRHDLPDLERTWTLDRRDKRAKKLKDPNALDLVRCSSCTQPYYEFLTACPHCGAEQEYGEPSSRTIETVAGDLILLDHAKLEEMRRNTVLENPGTIAARIGSYHGHNAAKNIAMRQMEKIAAQTMLKNNVAQWAAFERAAGFTDRQIHKKFYATLGMDLLSALSESRSRQDYEATAQRVESWYRS